VRWYVGGDADLTGALHVLRVPDFTPTISINLLLQQNPGQFVILALPYSGCGNWPFKCVCYNMDMHKRLT